MWTLVALMLLTSPADAHPPRPPAPVEVRGTPPDPAYVWIVGHWRWRHGAWDWASGFWHAPTNWLEPTLPRSTNWWPTINVAEMDHALCGGGDPCS